MYVMDMIALAKQGDENAFNALVKHYEKYFCDKVVANNDNDESLRESAKDELPKLIRSALKLKYNRDLSDYLKRCSKNIFKGIKKINDSRILEKDEIISIYEKRFFNSIKEYNTVLTEEELKKYSYDYIKDIINKYFDNRDTLIKNITPRISREKNYYINEETLLLRYTYLEGINDKVVDFFIKKYSYILEEYKLRNSYSLLKNNFYSIVEQTLKNISFSVLNLEPRLRSELQKKGYEYGLEVSKTSIERKDDIYDINLNIKDYVFEKYSKKVGLPEDELRSLIDSQYDKYYDAYLNGKSKVTIRKYMFTRFEDFFKNRKMPRVLTDELREEKRLNELEYLVYIKKNLKKLNTNHPYELLEKDLTNTYNEYLDKYYMYEMKMTFKEYIASRLRIAVEELNEKYSDYNIINIKNNMNTAIKDNKNIDSNIVDEIMDNLTSYYISKKMENKVPFELFIIKAIENFDMEEYLMIKDVKEHINLKVLKRPSIK